MHEGRRFNAETGCREIRASETRGSSRWMMTLIVPRFRFWIRISPSAETIAEAKGGHSSSRRQVMFLACSETKSLSRPNRCLRFLRAADVAHSALRGRVGWGEVGWDAAHNPRASVRAGSSTRAVIEGCCSSRSRTLGSAVLTISTPNITDRSTARRDAKLQTWHMYSSRPWHINTHRRAQPPYFIINPPQFTSKFARSSRNSPPFRDKE